MIDYMAHPIQTGHRAGRMLELAVDAPKGTMLLTTELANAEGSKYHQTFRLRRWDARDGDKMMSVDVEGSGDWKAGIKKITVMHLNLSKLRALASKDSRAQNPMLRYAAEAALAYAWLGEMGLPTPKNGTVKVTEHEICARCGKKLTNPKSKELLLGPECAGKATGTKTIMSRAKAVA